MYDVGHHMDEGKIAAYHPASHGIYVNEDPYNFRDSVGMRNKLRAKNWLSTDHPFGSVWHEYGHAAHKGTVGSEEFERLGGELPPEDTAAKVSKYAKTADDEFVAETFAGMMAGHRYDMDVMDLYRRYGGPAPPRGKWGTPTPGE
jgi:hypothetical protein